MMSSWSSRVTPRVQSRPGSTGVKTGERLRQHNDSCNFYRFGHKLIFQVAKIIQKYF